MQSLSNACLAEWCAVTSLRAVPPSLGTSRKIRAKQPVMCASFVALSHTLLTQELGGRIRGIAHERKTSCNAASHNNKLIL
jgi:hypothetical protein